MTDLFLQKIRSLCKEDITLNEWNRIRRCLIDYMAVTLSGACIFKEKQLDYLESNKETGKSTIIGIDRKTTKQAAALFNGMNAHVIEMDDGHRVGALHVGATVFSSLLAVAEHENLSIKDVLYGAIIGYEATIRLACAVQPGNKLKGYHATGTCGTVGAALGIAAAMGQDFGQMKSTLSAAVTSAAGLLEMQEDNSELKPLNVGRAAMDAVSAAYIGKARFRAPKDAIGGKRGFLKVMTDDPHVDFITDFNKDTPLAVSQIYMKTYASCRHTHPAIEAALMLRKKVIGRQSDIMSIDVETYRLAVIGHDHTEILGVSSAKMSMPFCIALALCKGSAGMADFSDDTVTDGAILSLTRKVKVSESAELTALVPAKRASILYITLYDGTTYSQRVDYPKGEPENPLTEDELNQKFISLAKSAGFTHERCNAILHAIADDNLPVSILMNLL